MQHLVRRPSRWMLSAIVIASLLAAASVQPAVAHETSVPGPEACGVQNIGAGGVGGVNREHTWVWVRDDSPDGCGYDVLWTTRSGKSGRVGDSNGSEPGGGDRVVTTSQDPVVAISVCNRTKNICTTIST
jgi:hypothetical protein